MGNRPHGSDDDERAGDTGRGSPLCRAAALESTATAARHRCNRRALQSTGAGQVKSND